jgi:hypothetical protein
MPHIHPFDGFSMAASEYQAYLERMRASAPDEHELRAKRKRETEAPGEYVDPEAESPNQDTSPEDERGEPEENEESADEGFGSHYA